MAANASKSAPMWVEISSMVGACMRHKGQGWIEQQSPLCQYYHYQLGLTGKQILEKMAKPKTLMSFRRRRPPGKESDMPERSEGPKKQEEEEVRFIGVSAKEFLQYAAEERKAGSFAEKTRVNPKIRDSFGQFVTALEETEPDALQYYVFVFSRFIIIKIRF